MKPLLLTFVIILSTLFVGNVLGQDTFPLAGNTFTIDEYKWEFKENGIVFVSGGEAGDGTEGQYEQEGNRVFIKVPGYNILGTYDGKVFEITGIEESETSSDYDLTSINYDEVRIKEFPIALQCYTFRNFSFMETLDKARELGIRHLQAYPAQKLNSDGSGSFNVDMTEDEKTMVKNKLKELGLTLKLFGVADVFDETSGRKLFEFAKDMEINTIVIEPNFHLLPMIDKLANQYQINVAIHNHPKPSGYFHPGITYYHIKDLSARIGLCGDTGHWTRSGVISSAALKLFKGRIFDVHLKDLNEFGNMKAYDVPFGSGKSNIRDILAELSLQNYRGTITIEHEKEDDAKNPGPAIKKGLEYIRKITYYEGYQEILGFREGQYHKHGWNHYGPGYFELDQESGILTSSGGMGLLWYSTKMYDNFVLELDYICHASNTNSGIFLRIPEDVKSNDYIYKSFEIQIEDQDTLTKHTTGAVYDAEPAKLIAANPAGTWNHYRITFLDDLIKVELNGQLINNWRAVPRGKIKSFAKKGYIGLQNHDSDAKVSSRNVFIKEL
jgi:sugar phosphate isomerase/epimerase